MVAIANIQTLRLVTDDVRMVKSDGVPPLGYSRVAAASSADGSTCKVFARQTCAHPDA